MLSDAAIDSDARRAAPVTGSMLADLVGCERRLHNDLFAPRAARDEVNGFIELLWSNGSRHEAEILDGMRASLLDLRTVPSDDRATATAAALAAGAKLIAGARFELGDRVGMPDLVMVEDGVAYAGDIKSGSPFENGVPKLAYGVQVGFYARLMSDLGIGSADRAFVVGDDGQLVWFDLDAARRGGASIADRVAALTELARGIRDGSVETTAAAGAACGLCVWKSLCHADLAAVDDPTLVAGLGRATRGQLATVATSVTELAALPIGQGAPSLRGIGPDRLATFVERARALRTPGSEPYAKRPLALERRHHEFHLDLETDPTAGNHVYLHGLHECVGVGPSAQERYIHFLATTPAEERDAFAAALALLESDPDALITTYSAFERTTYRMLQRRYPEVATAEQVEAMFSPPRCVDLYFDAVLPATVWPLGSLGLKAVARYLGFEWRDGQAGGAASISWFVDYAATRDPVLLERVLDYNADDCAASAAVLDGLISLPVRGPLPWPPAAARRH